MADDHRVAKMETTPRVITEGAPPELRDLLDAIAPIIKAVDVNDSDTLSMMRSNNEVIWQATGSWSPHAEILLGDLRRIALLAKQLELAQRQSAEAQAAVAKAIWEPSGI